MRSGCIIIGIFIVILIIVIYIAKNILKIKKCIEEKTFLKKSIYIVIILCIICEGGIFLKDFKSFEKSFNQKKESNEEFNKDDKVIEDEINRYDELMSKEYEQQNSMNPYIPIGFEYVEGEWNSGFVIQDNDKNQYVWVPCTNKNNENIEKLQRMNTTLDPFIDYNDCNNLEYEYFIESALTYGGFYVSRYELGEKEGKIISQKNNPILKDITRGKAIELINSINYNDVKCKMINGYAYDTIYNWLDCGRNNSNIIMFSSQILSGRNEVKNIYDFEDNVLEYTMENLYNTVIIRGCVDSKDTEYTNDLFSKQSRYCILENECNYGVLNVNSISIAVRTVLYK